jgi:hypothetical protein
MEQLRSVFREELVSPQAMIAQLGAAAKSFFLGDTQVFLHRLGPSCLFVKIVIPQSLYISNPASASAFGSRTSAKPAGESFGRWRSARPLQLA